MLVETDEADVKNKFLHQTDTYKNPPLYQFPQHSNKCANDFSNWNLLVYSEKRIFQGMYNGRGFKYTREDNTKENPLNNIKYYKLPIGSTISCQEKSISKLLRRNKTSQREGKSIETVQYVSSDNKVSQTQGRSVGYRTLFSFKISVSVT